ncbi:hypothetical protein DL89DRAFT_62749 [Linderina pennispora]|uniref:Uncharacterized protein n=1 Tax=Linderina pennispora TaxID=61395 RepID=A0A1Y1VS88_9FUNG|nr:uncharacterized protein DL89DRAFT_62749 [Linderina pennispora]ORX63905.1 hypothetical protein DL89DRAFT_62749 [Linderina pennispora]
MATGPHCHQQLDPGSPVDKRPYCRLPGIPRTVYTPASQAQAMAQQTFVGCRAATGRACCCCGFHIRAVVGAAAVAGQQHNVAASSGAADGHLHDGHVHHQDIFEPLLLVLLPLRVPIGLGALLPLPLLPLPPLPRLGYARDPPKPSPCDDDPRLAVMACLVHRMLIVLLRGIRCPERCRAGRKWTKHWPNGSQIRTNAKSAVAHVAGHRRNLGWVVVPRLLLVLLLVLVLSHGPTGKPIRLAHRSRRRTLVSPNSSISITGALSRRCRGLWA